MQTQEEMPRKKLQKRFLRRSFEVTPGKKKNIYGAPLKKNLEKSQNKRPEEILIKLFEKKTPLS